MRARMGSPASKSAQKGFAGPRLVAAIAGLACAPVLIAALVAFLLDAAADREDPWAELEERSRAGAIALTTFDQVERAQRDAFEAAARERRSALRARAEALVLTRSLAAGDAPVQGADLDAWIDG